MVNVEYRKQSSSCEGSEQSYTRTLTIHPSIDLLVVVKYMRIYLRGSYQVCIFVLSERGCIRLMTDDGTGSNERDRNTMSVAIEMSEQPWVVMEMAYRCQEYWAESDKEESAHKEPVDDNEIED